MNVRSLVFWLKDATLGHGIMKKNILDVKLSFEQDGENNEQLQNILRWATTEVPFYAQYRGVQLSDFPIVNKNIIRSGGEKISSIKISEQATS